MQTISVPFTLSDDDAARVVAWRRRASTATRTAYVAAATWDRKTGAAAFAEHRDVLDAVKARFAHEGPATFGAVDAWILHCATLDGFSCRRRVPSGTMVFGGAKLLERRRKGLVTRDEWREARLRPLTSVGDKDKHGNRHFRLSADARICVASVYGNPVTLHLPRMAGRWGAILPMLARLADAREVSLTFRLGRRLEVSFDEMDLRRLPAGTSLQAAKDADAAALGHRRRGRPRGAGYVAPRPRWAGADPRPVHPEWREPVPTIPGRAVGVDLNPNWIGVTALDGGGDPRSLDAARTLGHRLIRLDVPADAPVEVMREALAGACRVAVDRARAVGAGLVVVEDGIGKLRSRTRGKAMNRLINGWARTVFVDMLTRKARLAGLRVTAVWGGYSTTVGNLGFALPDACASAAEIARRGLVVAAGRRDEGLLPAYRTEVGPGLWKDRDLPRAGDTLRRAGCWRDAHRGLKAAKLGVRRPHPASPGPDGRTACGHAVVRLGRRGTPGVVHLPSKPRGGHHSSDDGARLAIPIR